MKPVISKQAADLGLAITSRSAVRLSGLSGQPIALTVEDLTRLYDLIGMTWVAETLTPKIDELVKLYGKAS